MYCKKCNHNNHEGAAFCAFCGAPLAVSEPEPPTTALFYTPDLSNTYYTNPPAQTVDSIQQTEEVQDDSYVVVQPAPQKRKFKKALVIVPIALIAVVLIGLLAVNLLIDSSPQYQVIDGITNSLSELEANMKSAETFYKIYDDTYACINDKEYAVDYRVEKLYGEDLELQLKYSYSNPKKFLRIDANFDIESVDLDFTLAANREKLMLELAQLNDNYYTLPLNDFGKEYKDSEFSTFIEDNFEYDSESLQEVERVLETLSVNLFADTGFQAFCDAHDDFDNWVTNLKIEETDQDIPYTKNLTVYRTKIELEDLIDIYAKYYQFQLEQLLGKEAAENLDLDDTFNVLYDDAEGSILVVYFGINKDDCLSAIYGYEEGDEADSFGIVLAGNKNIWEEVIIYEGEEEIAGLYVQEKSQGFVVEFFDIYDGERETAAILECDDKSDELVISTDDVEYVIKYAKEDGRNVFTFGEDNGEIKFSIAISPFDGIKLPEGKEKSLFDFDQEDFENLVVDIIDAFQ